jgi:metal-sulfur cluster biosynthetic enzyme
MFEDQPLQNANPVIVKERHEVTRLPRGLKDLDKLLGEGGEEDEEEEYEYFDNGEVFDHIRNLNDPEHPLTLEQLNVVSMENVTVEDPGDYVFVQFTPTIPHCSMATLIGLTIRVKLLRVLPTRFKVIVKITPGTHQSEIAINKQLNDKERVAAALENKHLLGVVNKCIAGETPQ